MSRKKTKRPIASSKPDDTAKLGHVSISRFGNHIVSNVNWPTETFEKVQGKLVADHDDVIREIDEKIQTAVSLLAKLDPLKVLHRAWWERSAALLLVESEVDFGLTATHASRMLDYVQSLIASAPIMERPLHELTDEIWGNLNSLIGAIFRTLNERYFLCATAKRRANGAPVDAGFEKFYFQAQLYWCNVRGKQYQNHQIQSLRELLEPQTRAIEHLYGVTGPQLCEEIGKIWHSQTYGISDAFNAIGEIQTQTQSMTNLYSDITDVADIKLQEKKNQAIGVLIGYDLFDLQKITTLPTKFLEHFSWSPGEDDSFLSEGPFGGWPLKVWPTFKRPFMKLNGRYYCFDISSLFDHFYRQLEKRVSATNKNLQAEWEFNRNKVTESLPFNYLKQILPGATCIQGIYYRTTDRANKVALCETDGIVIFDDHLFIVEVKAGSFTYTSPTTDFGAHIESVKNLVLKPAYQGNRFLQYLQTGDTVPLLDHQGKLTSSLRLRDYRQVTLCAVSLDPFTEIAAQVQHIPLSGIDVGDTRVWALSLDDLRVYADVFTSPLHFLHFVQIRQSALESEVLQLDDELDHLGLYLQHNNYVKYAADLHAESAARLQFLGYRQEIDKFFSARLFDAQLPSPLHQPIHERLRQLLQFLSSSRKHGRSKISAYLLDVSGKWRDQVFDALTLELKRAEKAKPRPFSSSGDVRLTIYTWTPRWRRDLQATIADHIKAIMLIHEEEDRMLLEISYDESGEISDASWELFRREDIPFIDMPRLQLIGHRLRSNRLRSALSATRSIGRNEKCPCGSGKKFKRCCSP